MNANNSFWLRSLISILVALPAAVFHPASAAVVRVTNDGADSSSCGSHTAPCRSISQGIENALDGDTIYVGPGRYGNVNGDSTFSGPGDERPEAGVAPWDSSGCIVCINKGVHIYSTAGAELTVIDSGGAQPQYQSTVLILSDGADFGAARQGFTITGGNAHGVTIEPNFSARGVARNISVSGNIDLGDGDGVFFFGDDFDPASFIGCPPIACTFSARVLIADNRLVNNGIGVNVVVNDWAGQGSVVIRDNQAINAGYGYWIFPGFPGGQPHVSPADNVRLINNIAANGNVGFYVVESGPIESNTAIDNTQSGFVVTPGGAPFIYNAALGNGGPGVLINLTPDPFDLGNTLTFQSFNDNTFAANDRSRPAQLLLGWVGGGSYNPGSSAHCGVLNLGPLGAVGGATQVTPVPATLLRATNNYWGSATGPSRAGAGDAVGGPCDQNSATTFAKPFLSTRPRSTVSLDP